MDRQEIVVLGSNGEAVIGSKSILPITKRGYSRMPIDVKKRKWPRWRPWFDMDRAEMVVPGASGEAISSPFIIEMASRQQNGQND